MRQVCISRDGLTRVAPAHAGHARLLLSLVSAADSLAQLETLNSLTLVRTGKVILLRLGAVEIQGVPTRPAHAPKYGQLTQLDTRVGLKIQQIRVGGQAILREIG